MPSIEKQLLPIPLKTGLQQKEAAAWLQPGAMLTAQNAVKLKASSMQKRPGFLALNSTSPTMNGSSITYTLTVGRRLGTRQGVITAFADDAYTTAIWQYDEQTQLPVPYDRVPEVYVAPPVPVVTMEQSAMEMDEVIYNGIRLVVWLADMLGDGHLDVCYTLQDAATNETLIPPQNLTAGVDATSPKLVLCGSTAILCYSDAAHQHIHGYSFDMTQPFVLPTAEASPLVTDANSGISVFDLSNVAGDTAKFCLAYVLITIPAGSTRAIRVARCSFPSNVPQVDLTGTINDTQFTTDSTPALDGICVRADSTNSFTWYAYAYRYGGANRRVRSGAQQWPTVTNVVKAPFDLENLGNTQAIGLMAIELVGTIATNHFLSPQTGVHMVAWSPTNQLLNAGASSTQYTRTAHVDAANGLLNGTVTTWNITLGSRFIKANDRAYLGGYLNSPVQGSYFLFAIDYWTDIDSTMTHYPMRMVANIGTRLGSGPPASSGAFAVHAVVPHAVPNASAPGGNVFEWCVSVAKATGINGPTVYQIDFNSTKAYQNCELGTNMGYACGCPCVFDGARSFEFSFPYAPEQLTSSFTNSGGFITTGNYSYVAIYEQRDWSGQVHRSGRSPALGVVVPINTFVGSVGITVPTMTYSMRQRAFGYSSGNSSLSLFAPQQPPITIKLYRTKSNGSTYYLCDSTDVVSTSTISTFNDITVGNKQLTDTTADAQLETHPLLYGDGGLGINGSSVDNKCPPAFQNLITHKNRFWGVDGNNIWYSKAFTSYEGSGFNETFAFSVDDGSGPITALASMDDKLVIFKSSAVYFVTGDGPTDGGGQNDLSPPQRITSSVGCTDWRSVVVRGAGVQFWSKRGQYMLTRDLQVVPVPTVEDAMTTQATPTSAVLHPSASRIIWTANTNDTSNPRSGIGLAYDDVLDSWTTWQYKDGSVVHGAVSAAVAQVGTSGTPVPTYHWLQANGLIMRELPATYLDSQSTSPPTFQVSTYQTPWIKAGDIQGFARWRRLFVTFQSLDPHALSVFVSYDYESTQRQIGSFSAAQIAAMATPYPQVKCPLPRHRAEAVQFTITDASDSGTSTGQGLLLLGLTLEIGRYTNQRGVRLPAAQSA
jgi:hypothetical protein